MLNVNLRASYDQRVWVLVLVSSGYIFYNFSFQLIYQLQLQSISQLPVDIAREVVGKLRRVTNTRLPLAAPSSE